MERAARELVEKFDWKQIAQRTVESYRQTLPQREAEVLYDRYQLTAEALRKGGSVHESRNHGGR